MTDTNEIDDLEDAATFGEPVTDDDGEDAVLFEVDGLDEINERFRIPVGLWEVDVLTVERKNSENSGNPMLVIDVVLTGRWYDKSVKEVVDHPKSAEHGGKEIRDYMPLSKKALFRVVAMAKALDLPMVGGALRCTMKQLVGKRFLALLKEEPGRDDPDEKRMKIGAWKRHPEGPNT